MHPPSSAISRISSIRRRHGVLLATTLAWLTSAAAHSATFSIANGDIAALRNAINVCNTNAQDDTINLATNGSYIFTDATSPPVVSVAVVPPFITPDRVAAEESLI